MIPANIDYKALLADLNAWGIRDYKIEMICGLTVGHLAQVKSGAIQQMKYPNAARLYNFWFSEKELKEEADSRKTARSHSLAATTT